MMSYLFKYFLHYSKCIPVMYLFKTKYSLSLSIYKCICVYVCICTQSLAECVSRFMVLPRPSPRLSLHSSAMHWPRLRCASSSPPSSSSSSRTIERGCRPDRTRGARTAMISGVWSARKNLEQSAKMANDSPAKSLVDIDLASLRVSGCVRVSPRGSGLAAAGGVPDALRSCSRLLLTGAMLFVWLQDPAGIFELVEVVGNGTYGQVYKVGVDWVLLHSQRALLHLRDYSIIVLQHFYWSRGLYQRMGVICCACAETLNATKNHIDYKPALKQCFTQIWTSSALDLCITLLLQWIHAAVSVLCVS